MKFLLLIHRNGKIPLRVISSEGERFFFRSKECAKVLWELAENFPNSWIVWCEERLEEKIAWQNWRSIFRNDLIMASFPVFSKFLPEQLGYVDRHPAVNASPKQLYGTWRMSSDIGGIKGEVLLKFHEELVHINGFDFLLNSIGKLGQENGLFCYSAPQLVRVEQKKVLEATASVAELFSFIFQHYNSQWSSILFFCYIFFEKSFPLRAYLRGFLSKKLFKKEIDLARMKLDQVHRAGSNNIDVIIPTIGRKVYLHKVLKDLAQQHLLPKRVIIVEQNPELNSISDLDFLYEGEWPFEISHRFIHRTGVCYARNLALREVSSNWIFFADDDIRLEPEVLQDAISELYKYGSSAINMNCLQMGENSFLKVVKQWGAFGSGTSIVEAKFLSGVKFSEVFEFGYGEDLDFGMQLRKKGCDIIFHPKLKILHLKAPVGGFRQEQRPKWEQEKIIPKPSPTMMAFARKHYTKEQLLGFKVELWLRYFKKQPIKNPLKYHKNMKSRWKRSEVWAARLERKATRENEVFVDK